MNLSENEYLRIVDLYADTVYKIAISYSTQKQDAEDIFQNVFLKLYKNKKDFQDEDHIRKWLIKVTVNESKNIWKTFWNRNVDSIDELNKEPIFLSEDKSELYYAVQELEPKYRIVVHLYYYEGYSVKEISEVLKVKETTIQTRLLRARRQLKSKLKEMWCYE